MANEFKVKNGLITPSGTITNTTTSTSTTSGALTVAGGAGIAGNVYANAFFGNGNALSNLSGSNVIGSVSTANNVTLASQPNITSVGTLTSVTCSGVANITNTTISTSTTTGALKVAGGAGIAGNVYADSFYVDNRIQITSSHQRVNIADFHISMGSYDGTVSAPYIDFNTGATVIDYDVRILASGGDGTNGNGNLSIFAFETWFTGKFGYISGSTVTQLTSRTTGVTINDTCGRIILFSASTTAGANTSFTVTNSLMTSTDVVIINQYSGSGYYIPTIRSKANGSFVVNIYTPTAASTEAPVFDFAIIRSRVA